MSLLCYGIFLDFLNLRPSGLITTLTFGNFCPCFVSKFHLKPNVNSHPSNKFNSPQFIISSSSLFLHLSLSLFLSLTLSLTLSLFLSLSLSHLLSFSLDFYLSIYLYFISFSPFLIICI